VNRTTECNFNTRGATNYLSVAKSACDSSGCCRSVRVRPRREVAMCRLPCGKAVVDAVGCAAFASPSAIFTQFHAHAATERRALQLAPLGVCNEVHLCIIRERN